MTSLAIQNSGADCYKQQWIIIKTEYFDKKTLIKEKGVSYITSGSKNISDKINLTENPEIIIWGVVTYVIHKQQ